MSVAAADSSGGLCTPQTSNNSLFASFKRVRTVRSVQSNSSLNSILLATESASPRSPRTQHPSLFEGRSVRIKRKRMLVLPRRRIRSEALAVVWRVVRLLDASVPRLTRRLVIAVLGLGREALAPPLTAAALRQVRHEVQNLKNSQEALLQERDLLVQEVTDLQNDVYAFEDERESLESEMLSLREAAVALTKPFTGVAGTFPHVAAQAVAGAAAAAAAAGPPPVSPVVGSAGTVPFGGALNQTTSSSSSTPTTHDNTYSWTALNRSLNKQRGSHEGFATPFQDKCPHCAEPYATAGKWCSVTGARHRSDAEKEMDVLRRRLSAIARDELSRGFIADGSVVYHSDGDTPETSPRRRMSTRGFRDSPLSFSGYSDSRRHTDSSIVEHMSFDEDTLRNSRRASNTGSDGTPPIRGLRKNNRLARGFRRETGSPQDDAAVLDSAGATPPERTQPPERVGTMAQMMMSVPPLPPSAAQQAGLTREPTIPRIISVSSPATCSPSSTPGAPPLQRVPTLPTSALEQVMNSSFGTRRSSTGASSEDEAHVPQPVLRKSTMPMPDQQPASPTDVPALDSLNVYQDPLLLNRSIEGIDSVDSSSVSSHDSNDTQHQSEEAERKSEIRRASVRGVELET